MDGRTQYGLAMCCHFEDYLSGAIKKHELTRPDKEEDRMIHVRNQQGQHRAGVLRLSRQRRDRRASSRDVVKNNAPGVRFHGRRRLRPPVVGDPRPEDQRPYHGDFRGHPGALRRRRTPPHGRRGARGTGVPARRIPNHTGYEEYCYFLAVTFPAGQLPHHRLQPRGEGPERPDACASFSKNCDESVSSLRTRATEEYRPAPTA